MASSSSSSWHNGPSGQFLRPYVPAAAAATTRAEPGEEPECEDLAALTDHMEPPPLEVEAPRWIFQPASPLLRNKCLHAWRTKRLHHSLSFWKMAKHIYLSPWRCDHSRPEPGRKFWISGGLNMEAKHLHHTPRRCHYSNADPRGWGKASIIQYLEDWQWWMFLGNKIFTWNLT